VVTLHRRKKKSAKEKKLWAKSFNYRFVQIIVKNGLTDDHKMHQIVTK
jgi:hypothetical protein